MNSDYINRRAALYTLIAIVDANDGNVIINGEVIKRVFNDENDIVKVEFKNGQIELAADVSFEGLNSAVTKWKEDNPNDFEEIINRSRT